MSSVTRADLARSEIERLGATLRVFRPSVRVLIRAWVLAPLLFLIGGGMVALAIRVARESGLVTGVMAFMGASLTWTAVRMGATSLSARDLRIEFHEAGLLHHHRGKDTIFFWDALHDVRVHEHMDEPTAYTLVANDGRELPLTGELVGGVHALREAIEREMLRHMPLPMPALRSAGPFRSPRNE